MYIVRAHNARTLGDLYEYITLEFIIQYNLYEYIMALSLSSIQSYELNLLVTSLLSRLTLIPHAGLHGHLLHRRGRLLTTLSKVRFKRTETCTASKLYRPAFF